MPRGQQKKCDDCKQKENVHLDKANAEANGKDQSNKEIMNYLRSMESRWNKRLDDREARNKNP